jgi:alpha-L-rhamnosidase
MRPLPDPRIKRGGGDYDSVMGRISTDWAHTPYGEFALNVTVPANCTAHIYLPAHASSRIREGETDIARRTDLRIVQRSPNEVVVGVGSGTYRFVVGAATNVAETRAERAFAPN